MLVHRHDRHATLAAPLPDPSQVDADAAASLTRAASWDPDTFTTRDHFVRPVGQ